MDSIVKRLLEARRLEESTGNAKYQCLEVQVDDKGVMEILCKDLEYDGEEFTKYIGQVEDPSATKAARMLLKDYYFDVPKDIRNELIGTFGLEEYGFQIEESSEYDDEIKHPYVGKRVRYKQDGRVYQVTRAYDTRDGVAVRVDIDGGHQTITMKPDEYRLMKEAVDPMFDEDLKRYVGKPLKNLLHDLSGKTRFSIETDKPSHYGNSGFNGRANQVTWEYADYIIKEVSAGDDRYVDVNVLVEVGKW